jgi:hypothetical protein
MKDDELSFKKISKLRSLLYYTGKLIMRTENLSSRDQLVSHELATATI